MPSLPEAERHQVLAQALAATKAITGHDDHEAVAGVLAAVAPYLPVDLLPQALTLATSIRSDQHQAESLAALAPYLRADLLTQALAAATSISSDYYRSEALARLASFLPKAKRRAVIAQALAAANAMTKSYRRAEALATVARHLPETRRRAGRARVGDPTVVMARALDDVIWGDEFGSPQAMAALAPYLPTDMLSEALHIVADVLGVPDLFQGVPCAQVRGPGQRGQASGGLRQHLAHRLQTRALRP